MTEWLLVSLPLTCALFWRLGGAGVPPLRKAWRRYALPFVVLTLLLLLRVPILLALGAMLGLVAVNVLPYGDRTPWPMKLAVAALLGAPAMVIHFSAWFGCVLTLFCFGGSLALSRRFNWWSQSLVEVSGGFAQGLSIALAALIRLG